MDVISDVIEALYIYTSAHLFYLLFCRDGMIKRPGNESYLRKVMSEEHKAYSKFLEVGSDQSEEDSENAQSD